MESDRLRGLLEPETRTIIRFYFWAACPGKRNRTIIRSGQQVAPGWAGARKRTMAVFCGLQLGVCIRTSYFVRLSGFVLSGVRTNHFVRVVRQIALLAVRVEVDIDQRGVGTPERLGLAISIIGAAVASNQTSGAVWKKQKTCSRTKEK